MPDITPVEWKTTVGVIGTVLTVLLGLDITDAQKATAVSALVGVWLLGQTVGNAIIRHGRSTGVGAVLAQALPVLDTPPVAENNDSGAVIDEAQLAQAGDVPEVGAETMQIDPPKPDPPTTRRKP